MGKVSSIDNRKILVYRHRTLDTKEVFYIGIGGYNRPYKKHGRTLYWKNIVNKHGYSIEILQNNLSWEEACELEELLILEYGRRDLNTGYLVNMTSGGEGIKNFKMSKQTKEKIKKSNKGRKHSTQQNLEKSIRQQGQGGKKIINTLTNQIYPSIVIASKETNIPRTTLMRYINNNKITLKYLENG